MQADAYMRGRVSPRVCNGSFHLAHVRTWRCLRVALAAGSLLRATCAFYFGGNADCLVQLCMPLRLIACNCPCQAQSAFCVHCCRAAVMPSAFHAAVLFVGAGASCAHGRVAYWRCLAGALARTFFFAALCWPGLFSRARLALLSDFRCVARSVAGFITPQR